MPPDEFPVLNDPSETTRVRLRYGSSRSAIAAVPDPELLPLNVDVSNVTATILGAIPKIVPHAAELATLPGFDVARLDALEPHTLALYATHGMYLGATRPPEAIPE